MLKAHIDTIESILLANSTLPANASNSINKGTPRENFIKSFLSNHISERVSIGSGEIIDCNSVPNPPSDEIRPQMDIVIYKREYPRLNLSNDINMYLVESVVATIEVKSTLTEKDLIKSIKAAKKLKSLTKNLLTSLKSGYQPPHILNFVVAYDGPAKMDTVYNWLDTIHSKENILCPTLPSTLLERINIPSPSLEGIFVLGKGFIVFDNFPIGFITEKMRNQNPTGKWLIANATRGSLLMLFMMLTEAISGTAISYLNTIPYLRNFGIDDTNLKFQ